jgi:hypothetical protein
MLVTAPGKADWSSGPRLLLKSNVKEAAGSLLDDQAKRASLVR